MENNYQEDLRIDPDYLDTEWLNQPKLASKYGKIWAQAQKKVAEAEENIKVIRAELIAQVTENPEKYLGSGMKATVATIEAYYRNHKKHKEAKQEWIEAQYEANMAEVAKWEIGNSRKTALENLVKLHGQNYFAGPAIPHDLTKEWERKEHEKQVNEGIASKLSKRNK